MNGYCLRTGVRLPVEKGRSVRIVATGECGTVVQERGDTFRVFDFEQRVNRGWFAARDLEPYSCVIARLDAQRERVTA